MAIDRSVSLLGSKGVPEDQSRMFTAVVATT
jgi:hypothetical protein